MAFKKSPYHGFTCRRRGRKGRIYGNHDYDHMIFVQLPPSLHLLLTLNKTLYDDYLCLVASNKQQINWEEVDNNWKTW